MRGSAVVAGLVGYNSQLEAVQIGKRNSFQCNFSSGAGSFQQRPMNYV